MLGHSKPKAPKKLSLLPCLLVCLAAGQARGVRVCGRLAQCSHLPERPAVHVGPRRLRVSAAACFKLRVGLPVRCVLGWACPQLARFPPLTQTLLAVRFASLLCRQLGLGDDKNRWVPKLLNGYTIIHPDRTLRRNRKPVLKALLLQEEPASSSGRGGSARARALAAL